jgi:hypothetical protein
MPGAWCSFTQMLPSAPKEPIPQMCRAYINIRSGIDGGAAARSQRCGTARVRGGGRDPARAGGVGLIQYACNAAMQPCSDVGCEPCVGSISPS